jgi:NADPH:quinone reductase-like Zn-dependent oxidoreductase
VIDQVFPMSELAEAIAVMQRGQHVGKLVVRW